jgi:MFS family permease
MEQPQELNEHDLNMWPPGTIRIEDLYKAKGEDVILQPQPTDDPNDPLNWSNLRKYLNFFLCAFYALMVFALIDVATPTWGPMNEQLGFSYELLNDSYAIGCGTLALGAFLLIPFALKYGRRPVYIFSTLVQFAMYVWSAKLETVADLMLVNAFSCGVGAL